jgi:hypothetical protein
MEISTRKLLVVLMGSQVRFYMLRYERYMLYTRYVL